MSSIELRKKQRRWGRRAATKDVSPRILILCEGAKTEVRYFNAMKRDIQMTSLTIRHCNGISSVISSIDKKTKEFNEIWCVVDHDERHEDVKLLNERIRKIRRQQRRRSELDRIEAIISVPCFEYWLLIHFEYITRAYRGLPGKSACKQVTEQLKKHLPDYDKADPRIYETCCERMETAIDRAKKRREPTQSSTDVWKLIERFRTMDV